MSDQFIGEIRTFAGPFAPQGWAFCNGQLLQITQNEALYSLIGTTYGGDGRTTFALPNLAGRVAMDQGTNHSLGSIAGSETVTLQVTQLPAHTHAASAYTEPGTAPTAAGNRWANTGNSTYATSGTVAMSTQAVGTAGSSQAHSNMMPFTALSFIIALEGEYPQRP